jgi:bifunctional non-homologous end joining protein LigD
MLFTLPSGPRQLSVIRTPLALTPFSQRKGARERRPWRGERNLPTSGPTAQSLRIYTAAARHAEIEAARRFASPHEIIKYDGYRVQLHAKHGRATAYTRNGLDWTKRFAGITKAFDIQGEAILNGEAVVIEDGRTNFSELQTALPGGKQNRIEYYAFDLLYLDGYDLRAVCQIERKRLQKACSIRIV